ncbi:MULTISPECIES: IS4 family transposase [Aeromonas]|uniref:IS4 family transposase n=1 Tax=Aeromonas TaxID=642 RepID=UPI000DCFEABB|nr:MULTISPECIES: IS4 family transposase [Aeromonas]MBL0616838.1 IS4 family transposase [Aeromonas veronii]TNI77206.1 IS4 family transposase [Aeromonas sobria]
MTIIHANHYLNQLLAPAELERIARLCKFCLRLRTITPWMLVTSLLRAFGGDTVAAIASLHLHFNGLQLIGAHQVSYKPFHNQLRKPAFAQFMKALVERAIALRIDQQVTEVAQGAFKQVLLQDGTSFAVHKRLATVFPGRFKTISPAAIECHMLMSLLEQKPVCMQLSADTASERQFLPDAKVLTGSLLLADAGYISHAYFAEVNKAGGFYLVRGSKNLNPEILNAWRDDGRTVPKLTGMSLKEAGRRHCRAEVLDMNVRAGQYEYRLLRRWFAEEKRFCIWMTNLPRDAWPAERVMRLYRCRWQVELLFKEWKSHNNLKGFVTGQQAIAEGLVWASLLSLVLKRRVAQTLMKEGLSTLKAAKSGVTWWLPILEAIAHRAISEIRERLEWAVDFLSKNARRTKQRKSIQNRTLEGVLIDVFS